MNPADLIPVADSIPVPWGWFNVFLIASFLLHILMMNAMLGGGIIALIRSVQGSDPLPREWRYKWPYTIALTVNLGVGALLFVQVLYGQFIYTSSILMAVWWLSIVALLILAYYGAYIYDFRYDALGGMRVLFLGAVVVLMLVIAFFFSCNMTLMLDPSRWLLYFENNRGTLMNFDDPTLIPRYLHFVVGAVAVAGLFLALTGRFNLIRTDMDRDVLIRTGMTYFVRATLLQLVVGIWFLLALPGDMMGLYMGLSPYGTTLLVLGVSLALAALHFGMRGRVIPACITGLILLTVMILMRDFLRTAYLTPYFLLSQLSVQTEYSPLIFFLGVLAIGLALIGYMLRLVFNREATR